MYSADTKLDELYTQNKYPLWKLFCILRIDSFLKSQKIEIMKKQFLNQLLIMTVIANLEFHNTLFSNIRPNFCRSIAVSITK